MSRSVEFSMGEFSHLQAQNQVRICALIS